MLSKLFASIRSLFSRQPIRLAIVRRYQDANGNYVGELYMEQDISRKHDTLTGYTMIGVSLDALPLDASRYTFLPRHLDLDNDFLAPMERGAIRVGALDPKDNDNVRQMIAKMPKRNLSVTFENRFIEDLRPAGPLAFNLQTKTPEQIIQEFDKPC